MYVVQRLGELCGEAQPDVVVQDDVVAFPAETPLIRAARTAGTQAITGAEVIALQAAGQFERYTGVAPTEDQVERASTFSRA